MKNRWSFLVSSVALIATLSFLPMVTSVKAEPSEKGCSIRHTEMLYTVTLLDVGRGSGSATVTYSGERDGEVQTYLLTNYHVIK